MSGRELRELESLSASPRRKRNATAGLANGDEPPTKYCAANPLDEAGAVAELDEGLLHTELRCPICLCVMRDPVATDCLHRFCKDCIERYHRQAQKRCPSCRKPIATRRQLRPDANLAALISKLYPDLDAFEEAEERQMTIDNARRIKEHSAKMKVQRERQRASQAMYEADARQGRIARPRVELEVREAAAAASASGRDEAADEADVDADSAAGGGSGRGTSAWPAQRPRASGAGGGDVDGEWPGDEEPGGGEDGEGADETNTTATDTPTSRSKGQGSSSSNEQPTPAAGGWVGYYCDATGQAQAIAPRSFELGFRLQRHPLYASCLPHAHTHAQHRRTHARLRTSPQVTLRPMNILTCA